MLTAFLITTLIIFSLNVLLNVLVIGFNFQNETIPLVSIVNVIVGLLMITWNIVILVNN